MIAPNNEEQPEPQGGLGGSALRPSGIRDTRLIERALREGWPIPKKRRKAVVDRQLDIAESPDSSPREATSAARCLAIMAADNAAIAMKLLDKVVSDKHDHLLASADDERVALSTVISEPGYVEYLRNCTIQEDSDPGLICQISESGHSAPVENGEAHGPAGPGTNGHRNGRE